MKKLRVYALIILTILGLLLMLFPGSQDQAGYSTKAIQRDLAYLSGSTLQGRLAGSPGNELALSYVRASLEDSGYDVSTHQVSTISAGFSDELFSIDNGNSSTQLILYEDYSLYPWSAPDGIDFSGEIILADQWFYDMPADLMRGRIIVTEAGRIDERALQRAQDNGAAAIIFTNPPNYYRSNLEFAASLKYLDQSPMFSFSIPIGFLSSPAYVNMVNLTGDSYVRTSGNRSYKVIPGVHMSLQTLFPVEQIEYLTASIEGKSDSSIVLSATLDGPGEASQGSYFPAASHGASSTAIMLQLAREFKEFAGRPEATIVFAFFNGELTSGAASRDFFPSLQSQSDVVHIHLGNIGSGQPPLVLASDMHSSDTFRSRLSKIGRLLSLPVIESDYSGSSPLQASIDRGFVSLQISSLENSRNDTHDDASHIDADQLLRALQLVKSYVQRDVYHNVYRAADAGALIFWLAALTLAALGLSALSKFDSPVLRRPATLLILFFNLALPSLLALFIFVIIIHLPEDGRFFQVNSALYSNYLPELILSDSLNFMGQLLSPENALSTQGQVLFEAIVRTSLLLVSSLLLSMLAGLLLSWRRDIYRETSGYQAVIIASVPDVLVIMGIASAHIWFAGQFPGLNESLRPRDWLIPVLACSVVPTAYAARLTTLALAEQRTSAHLLFSRALGYSEGQILIGEILPQLIARLLDSIPLLLSIMLTTLILVEYLFDFKGLVFYLLYFIGRGDKIRYVQFSLGIAAVFIILRSLGAFLARLSGSGYRERYQ